MTRKTEIEVAAYDYAKDIPLLNTARNGFEAGAQWADEHPDIEAIKVIEDHAYFAGSEAMREKMLNKAYEWLYNALYTRANGAEHYVASKEKITKTEFVAKFRKYMEEE